MHIKLIFGGGENPAVLLYFFLNQNLKKHCKIQFFIVEYICYITRREQSDFFCVQARFKVILQVKL